MKSLFIGVFLLALGGCISPYQSYEGSNRAKITFRSPTLQGAFLSSTELSFIIFKADEKCSKKAFGKFVLKPKSNIKSTYVPANERGYFRISYFQNSFGGGSRSGMHDFSFIPESGKEYSFVYKDMPGKFKIDHFETSPSGENVPIDIEYWSTCEKSV